MLIPDNIGQCSLQFQGQAFLMLLQVLATMPRGGVAFYNCGEHSGRSQPHKHLQVCPFHLCSFIWVHC
jgi:ATP adenylyltransferase/5',5'''-P-1,P-4-tetraphosphate phosphorylase II